MDCPTFSMAQVSTSYGDRPLNQGANPGRQEQIQELEEFIKQELVRLKKP